MCGKPVVPMPDLDRRRSVLINDDIIITIVRRSIGILSRSIIKKNLFIKVIVHARTTIVFASSAAAAVVAIKVGSIKRNVFIIANTGFYLLRVK